MSQLSLLAGGGEAAPSSPVSICTVEPFTGSLSGRRLPLLRSVPLARSVLVDGRLRSYVTLPGYRSGQKPSNAGRKWPAELPSTAEVFALLDACGHGFTGERNRALYTMFWRCGLRCQEALDLLPRDLDLTAGTVTVLHGKGNKRRVVGFDQRTAEAFSLWLEMRAGLGVTAQQPVFCVVMQPTVGSGLYQSCVRDSIKRNAALAGILKRMHPHVLRHRFAVDLSREGHPLPIISKLLGHSNSAVTARYIDHVEDSESIEAAQGRVWPSDLRAVAA